MKTLKDSRVDEYIEDSTDLVKPLLVQLRKTVHRLCPGVVETIKWNVPFFLFEEKLLCGLGGFKAHAALGFWNDSYIKINSKEDIPADAKFVELTKKALASQKSKPKKSSSKTAANPKTVKKKVVKKKISKKKS